IPLVRPYARHALVALLGFAASLLAFTAAGSAEVAGWLGATTLDPARATWALGIVAALPLAVAIGALVAILRLSATRQFVIRATPEGLEFPAAPLVWRGGRSLHLGWREVGAVTPDAGGSYLMVHGPRMTRRIPAFWLPRELSVSEVAGRIAERGRRFAGVPEEEYA